MRKSRLPAGLLLLAASAAVMYLEGRIRCFNDGLSGTHDAAFPYGQAFARSGRLQAAMRQ